MKQGWFSVLARSLIMLAGFISCSLQASEKLDTYRGTLGTMPIVVELNLASPAQVTGRYFYQKYHRDLVLEGTLKGEALSLDEGMDGDSDTPRPTLTLQRNGTSGWQGQWKSPKGKILGVTLSKAEVPAPPSGADPYWSKLYQSSPYEYLRLQQLSLKPGKQQTFMGHTLRWLSEPESKIGSFEVLDGYPPEQLARINQQLRARLWDEVISYQACMLGSLRLGEGEFEQTVTPKLLSPTIVSVSIFTRYFCGGAHPDFGDSPLNLDVSTGKPLVLEDVLWVGDGQPFHYDDREGSRQAGDSGTRFETYSDYRDKHFAPWLVKQFQQFYPAQMKKPGDEDGCDYSDPEIWDFPAWYFTPKGLYMGPGFARVLRSCEGPPWPVLPYAVIAQHPGGVRLELPKE